MLTRALGLAVIWLVISAVITMLRGTHIRRGGAVRSVVWLLAVIGAGDLWALLTFGQPIEVAIFSALTYLFGIWCIARLPDWNGLGHVTWIMGVVFAAAFGLYSLAVVAFTPLHAIGFVLSCILFALEVLALLLCLTYTYETLDVCTRLRWSRRYGPAQPIPGYMPKVSLHVPAYNEPPEIVAATLRSLAKLDYPNLEVLLVDNNTPDATTWRPLEALCRQLGDNFKCLHLDKWPGYKSGALNFALAQTAPDAEIVGIIDADYQVSPEYLRETVPYLQDEQVAFLATPQDYREYQGNPFLEACYNAYRYFFEISMAARNEANAAIFAGTMGLIRKSLLEQIGGWDEWCITEDAEASLRLLKLGYKSVYVNRSYGRGLMPLDFAALKRQRFRWCFGGIQILRKHWEALMPWARWVDPMNRLTSAQRYFYLVGGVQWFNEIITLSFAFLALLGGIGFLFGWNIGLRPLVGALVAVPLIFLLLGLWRFLWALRHALSITWRQAATAMASFFSLSWVVTEASIQGLIQPRGVFLRTPKIKSRSTLLPALRVTQWETVMGLACGIVGVTLLVMRPSFTALAMTAFLGWQASLYLSAPAFSVLSEAGHRFVSTSSRGDIQGRFITENRAARWALALGGVLLAFLIVVRFLPAPSGSLNYSSLEPAGLQPQQLIGVPPLPTSVLYPTPIPAATLPPPSAVPTPQAAPTAVPTAQPLPTQVPTQRPIPTQVPTRQPIPTQAQPVRTPQPHPTSAGPVPTHPGKP